jgi:hypothetical protein
MSPEWQASALTIKGLQGGRQALPVRPGRNKAGVTV